MSVTLITGVHGFLGSHLADFLLTQGWEVAGVTRPNTHSTVLTPTGVTLFQCDILDKARIHSIVRQARPETIFHLAAQSQPVRSWQDPEATFEVNIIGTLNLLEAVRAAGLDAVVIVAGSSTEYGPGSGKSMAIREDTPLHPTNPYGVSKVASTLLTLLYRRAFEMKVVVVRPFFVIGPRKTGDVCSDFARGVVAVERGEQSSLKVGNVEVVRDFLDVEDAVRAMWLLAQRGAPGEAYNICSGVGHTIQTVLEKFVIMASRSIAIEHDPKRLRPVDEPVVVGDNSRLRALGWAPQVVLDESLARILAYWRRWVSVS